MMNPCNETGTNPITIPLPWAKELIALYESGAANQFILYGNINDHMLVQEAQTVIIGNLRDYLLQVLMAPFNVVLSYDMGNGIRIEKGGEIFSQWLKIRNNPELPKSPQPAIETLTHYFRYTANLARLGEQAPQVGCIINAAELIAPAIDMSYSYEINTIVLLIREWANDSLISNHAIATFLLTENLNDLHSLIAHNLHA